MQKPVLYLLVGYPGAGKTTAARIIQGKSGAFHIWADHERRKLFTHPTHSKEESKELYDQLNHATDYMLKQGKSVIFDTNFNFRKDRDYLRALAKSHGADTFVVWITTPKALARKRAVQDSHGQDTRLYGNMSLADFERIASHLQPPDEDEKVVKIDGTNLDTKALLKQLGL